MPRKRRRSERETISLRLQGDVVARISRILRTYPHTIPRNLWIAEAIVERLAREENGFGERQNLSVEIDALQAPGGYPSRTSWTLETQ